MGGGKINLIFSACMVKKFVLQRYEKKFIHTRKTITYLEIFSTFLRIVNFFTNCQILEPQNVKKTHDANYYTLVLMR